MTATPVEDGWNVHDEHGRLLGHVFGGLDQYAFFPTLCWLDADRARAIADFLDRVTAARKSGGS